MINFVNFTSKNMVCKLSVLSIWKICQTESSYRWFYYSTRWVCGTWISKVPRAVCGHPTWWGGKGPWSNWYWGGCKIHTNYESRYQVSMHTANESRYQVSMHTAIMKVGIKNNLQLHAVTMHIRLKLSFCFAYVSYVLISPVLCIVQPHSIITDKDLSLWCRNQL